MKPSKAKLAKARWKVKRAIKREGKVKVSHVPRTTLDNLARILAETQTWKQLREPLPNHRS